MLGFVLTEDYEYYNARLSQYKALSTVVFYSELFLGQNEKKKLRSQTFETEIKFPSRAFDRLRFWTVLASTLALRDSNFFSWRNF